MAGLLGLLIFVPLLSSVQALFHALLVQLATRLVAGFTPTYRVAYKAVFWGLVIAGGALALVSFFLALFMGRTLQASNPLEGGLGIIFAVGAFLLEAQIYAVNIEDYELGPISFKQACLIIPLSGLILVAVLGVGFALGIGGSMLVAKFG